MGFTAKQVKEHTAWEFWQVFFGWRSANVAELTEEEKPLDRDWLDELKRVAAESKAKQSAELKAKAVANGD